MKNLSLILNIILFALVGILYYLHFSGKNTASTVPTAIAPATLDHNLKIAYVNADTLDAKYEWLKQQKNALEQKMKNAESSMAAREESLNKEMQAFQQKQEGGTIPPAQLQQEYEGLMKRAQAFEAEKARLGKKLSDDQIKASNDLMTNVEAQLKSLQSQIGYDYILSYSKGGGQILLANDSLDITHEVLELLNAKKQ